jgi:hypothetical protein
MAKGCALPEEWRPTNGDRDYGHKKLHLSDSQIDELAEDMRLWAGANSNRQIARKADWSMAFKGWMRREAKKNGAANGKVGTGRGQGAGQRGGESFSAFSARRARDACGEG